MSLHSVVIEKGTLNQLIKLANIIFKWELRDGSEEKIYKQIEIYVLSMKAKDYLDMPDRVDTKQTVSLIRKRKKSI